MALSAPDKCAGRSSAANTGAATPAGEILSTTCGVEMAELERALVSAGYRVLSWNAVRQIVVYESGVTPLAAAKRLGATVLLQVNSLERSRVTRTGDFQWDHRFFESDEDGRKGATASITSERIGVLETGARRFESWTTNQDQTSVTVNATAILVGTGQSIWFYNWVHSSAVDDDLSNAHLFVCTEKLRTRCAPFQPRQPVRVTRAGDNEAVSIRVNGGNSVDAAYYRLVHEVVTNLVSAFGSR